MGIKRFFDTIDRGLAKPENANLIEEERERLIALHRDNIRRKWPRRRLTYCRIDLEKSIEWIRAFQSFREEKK